MNKLAQQKNLFLVAVLVSLVLVNVLGLRLFSRLGRVDFTQDHVYTLSPATKDTLLEHFSLTKHAVSVSAVAPASILPRSTTSATSWSN